GPRIRARSRRPPRRVPRRAHRRRARRHGARAAAGRLAAPDARQRGGHAAHRGFARGRGAPPRRRRDRGARGLRGRGARAPPGLRGRPGGDGVSLIELPARDEERSPFTGWGREHLVRVADAILDGAARHASPGGARIVYPGRPGGYGPDVDALEGFARTFLLASFRIAGDPGGTEALAARHARAIAAGADPAAPAPSPRPDEC